MLHKVLLGQTVMDISQIYFGDISHIGAIAQANNLNLTDDLQPNSMLQIPDITIDAEAKKVANYFQTRNTSLPIATNAQNYTVEGIEAWAVEYDFIVS